MNIVTRKIRLSKHVIKKNRKQNHHERYGFQAIMDIVSKIII
jgi:hypothetical protein